MWIIKQYAYCPKNFGFFVECPNIRVMCIFPYICQWVICILHFNLKSLLFKHVY